MLYIYPVNMSSLLTKLFSPGDRPVCEENAREAAGLRKSSVALEQGPCGERGGGSLLEAEGGRACLFCSRFPCAVRSGRTRGSLNASSATVDFRPHKRMPERQARLSCAREGFASARWHVGQETALPARKSVVCREKCGRPDLSCTRISCLRLPMVSGSGCSRRGKARWRNVFHESVRNSGIRRCTGVKGRVFQVRMLRRSFRRKRTHRARSA